MVEVFVGNNNFALRHALRLRTSVFVAEHGDMAHEQLDGTEVSFERMQESIMSMPFLATKKMVVLSVPSENKQFLEQFEKLFSAVGEDTHLLIIEPKIDKRTTYYKWLKKHATLQEYGELDAQQLASWAVTYAEEQGGVIAVSDAQYLVERVGINQQLLSKELDKLVLGCARITKKNIDNLTEKTPESKIFDLLDAAFSGKNQQAIKLYQEQRTMKVEPQEILAMLGWQLRQLALVKTAGVKHDVVKEAKMNPYVARKLQANSRAISHEHIKDLVHKLVTLDVQSKRSSIDLDDALQGIIISM